MPGDDPALDTAALAGDNSFMSATLIVQVTHRFNVPAERVFDAWLSPSLASRFFFATRTGNAWNAIKHRFTGRDSSGQEVG